MSDNPYYGFAKESTQGTAPPISEHTGMPYDPEWFSDGNVQHKPSLRSLLSRLFHRKAKPPVTFRESVDQCISIETEYNGKLYRGILYPVEEEGNAKQ